jgi:hypothetical protein
MGIVPSALKNRPTLAERWLYARSVWSELHGSRRYTMSGPANIPFSEYALYASIHGFTEAEMVEVWEDFRLIDICWLDEVAKHQKSKEEGRT